MKTQTQNQAHSKIEYASFETILRSQMQNQSEAPSRPLKIELKGLLVPTGIGEERALRFYKLDQGISEYALNIPRNLLGMARRSEWERVIVRGQPSHNGKVFEVESILLAPERQESQAHLAELDFSFDLEDFKKKIYSKGKLEPVFEHVAS